jgi:hypothetical protein
MASTPAAAFAYTLKGKGLLQSVLIALPTKYRYSGDASIAASARHMRLALGARIGL